MLQVKRTVETFLERNSTRPESTQYTIKKALRNMSELLELQNYKPQFTIYPFNKSVAHLVI